MDYTKYFLYLVHKQDFRRHSEQEDMLAYIQYVIHLTYVYLSNRQEGHLS